MRKLTLVGGQQGRPRQTMSFDTTENSDWTPELLDAVDILDVLGFHRRSGTFQVINADDAYGFHIQAGALEPIYLHDVLRGRRTIARDRALGGVLIRDGALSIEDLAAGIEEQAIEVLSRVIAL